MDILFILFGSALFLAAAAVFAIDHLKVNPAQAVVSFFVPPFAWWLFYHFWEKARIVAYTQGVALALLIGGVLMNLWFQDSFEFSAAKTEKDNLTFESEKDYVGSDASLRDLANAERLSAVLNGRVRGQSYRFKELNDTAEFDRQGIMRIKHGEGFHGDFELAIVFNEVPQKDKPWLRTYRTDSKIAPVIYLSWFDKSEQVFKSRKYKSGYNLDFKITHVEYNLFTGKMQLVLPDPENSFLVGEFPVYSSRLRFHGEGLIKTHDSLETLEAIAYQTLTVTYKKYVSEVLGFKETDFDYRSGSGLGGTTAFVKDSLGKIRAIALVFYKNENGWFMDVKGLKDDLKKDELILARLPGGIKAPTVIDHKNIGNLAATEASQADEMEEQTASNSMVQDSNAQLDKKEVDTVATKGGVASKSVEAPKQTETPQAPKPVVAQSIRIDVKKQQDQIETLLLGIFNKDVEVETLEGKIKKGIYVGVHRQQIVLESEVGGGVFESLIEYGKLKKLKVVNAPDANPQSVEFIHPKEQ